MRQPKDSILVKDIEPILQIVELNREIAVELQLFKEATEARLKHLNSITNKAEKLAYLRRKFKKDYGNIESVLKGLDISEQDKKIINNLLIKRHIKLL